MGCFDYVSEPKVAFKQMGNDSWCPEALAPQSRQAMGHDTERLSPPKMFLFWVTLWENVKRITYTLPSCLQQNILNLV